MSYDKNAVSKNLNQSKYGYINHRDEGDSRFTGGLDRTEVDKDEKYEVAYFIAQYLNHYKSKTNGFLDSSDIPEIEDTMHSFSEIKNRDKLAEKIANELGHKKK
ncbi:hypothetical protein [Acinetobacter pollinis]|uniref:Uncharacterized protein n=1 Tax=Acinetobacter pollinis TaxID=2605270 RepID=A0ABU6DWN9_9GAMM|nr:hypothetical protein [Acinetobacter pollinis]MEB5477589.1 hypothetical protein [Acinetobacter pollinis]